MRASPMHSAKARAGARLAALASALLAATLAAPAASACELVAVFTAPRSDALPGGRPLQWELRVENRGRSECPGNTISLERRAKGRPQTPVGAPQTLPALPPGKRQVLRFAEPSTPAEGAFHYALRYAKPPIDGNPRDHQPTRDVVFEPAKAASASAKSAVTRAPKSGTDPAADAIKAAKARRAQAQREIAKPSASPPAPPSAAELRQRAQELRTGAAEPIAKGRSPVADPRAAGAQRIAGRATPLLAGGLIVRVEDDGDPVAGANVCVGTPALPVRYGMGQTNGSGDARFASAPRDVPLQVIVARDGYEGVSTTLEYSAPSASDVEGCPPYVTGAGGFDPDDVGDCEPFDRDTVEIQPGSGGPTCPPQERGALRVSVANGTGAVVCVGQPSGGSAYGAALLGSSGDATFDDLPLNAPMRVIVDRQGYERVQEALILGQPGTTERSYTLAPGAGGGQIAYENGECVQQTYQVAQPELQAIPAAEESEPEPEPAISYASQGPIDFDEVVEAAGARGYGFFAEALNDYTGCEITEEGRLKLTVLNAVVAAVSGPSRCRFRLFVGDSLDIDWAIPTFHLNPHVNLGVEWIQQAGERRGANPLMIVELSHIGAGEREAAPTVSFYGPAGGDWRDTFGSL